MIKTSRLIIRPTEHTDLPYLMKWWNDPQVMAAVGFPRGLGITEDAMEAWYLTEVERSDMTRRHFLICQAEAGQPVGEIGYGGLDRQARRVDVGLKIGEVSCWRQGYGKEALVGFIRYLFQEYNLDTVYLDVLAANQPAFRLYQSLGFKIIPQSDPTYYDMKLSKETFFTLFGEAEPDR